MLHGGKLHKVMREFKEGTLKSSSGSKVGKRSQALAIAMSEVGKRKKRKKSRLGDALRNL